MDYSIVLGIKQTAHEYLSGAADQTAVLRRCASEDIEMEHPYYLVLFADQEMKQNNVTDDERLARRVCEQMLNVRTTHFCSTRGRSNSSLHHVCRSRFMMV